MGKAGGKGKKTYTVGYAYFMGLAFAIAAKIDELISFKMDGVTQASPALKQSGGSFVARTGKNSDISGSGQSTSSIRCFFGDQKDPDSYLSAKTGSPIAYKNIAYLVFRGFIGDNVRTVPNYSVVVRRTNVLGWSHENINGDANPAHVLYYILTKMAQYSPDQLDSASFIACAKTLYDEGLGMSFTMSSAQEAKEWCEEILRTIDAVLPVDPSSGKVKMKLLRGDYRLSECLKIHEGNSHSVTLTRKSWEDTVSRITVKYTERSSFAEASVSGVNTAARLILGYERAESIEYMGISSARNANIILNRLFKKLSYPLASLKCTVSQEEFSSLRVGDVISFSNTSLSISNMAFRVISLAGDKEDSQELEVEATEDIFSLGEMIITGDQPSEFVPPDFSIADLVHFTVREAKQEMADIRSLIPIAVFPEGFVQAIEVSDGMSGQTAEIQPWALGILTSSYPITKEIDEVGFDVSDVSGIWELSGTRAGLQRLKFVAYVGEEQIAFQFRSKNPDGSFRVSGIIRGLNNTTISHHPVGTKVWFASVDANEIQNLPIITPNPNLHFTPINFKRRGVTKSLSYQYQYSVETPYPPSNIKAHRDGALVQISWVPCVRLAGANYRNADNIVAGEEEGKSEGEWIVTWDDGNERIVPTPEFTLESQAETTYTIRSRLGGYLSSPQEIKI